MLRLAASVERGSEHPLAQAILQAASDRKLSSGEVRRFRVAFRQGRDRQPSTATTVALGNAMLMSELKIATADLDGAAETARQDGATAIFVAVAGRAAGMIAIADPIKPSAQPRFAGAARRRPAHRDADRR